MKKLFIALLLTIFSASAFAAKPQKEFERFAASMAKLYHFDKHEVVKLLQEAEEIHPVQQQVAEPVTRLPWFRFEPLFVNQRRIDNGVKFWEENQEVLDRAQEKFGVSPAIVVAVLGVETKYGATIGNFRTFDALVTLGFYTPKAKKGYFRNELKEFMLLAREQGWDFREIYGSYAGALGLPQFMPDSYRKFAVDFDNDGKIDLMYDNADAIGSVASFLEHKGWTPAQKIATPSECKHEPEGYIKRIKPSIKMIEWDALCHVIVVDADDYSYYNYPASLFSVEVEEGKFQFWNGFANFYALYHYNPSVNYVMAVYSLANEIEKARNK